MAVLQQVANSLQLDYSKSAVVAKNFDVLSEAFTISQSKKSDTP
jgi:hypothetical protein